MEGHPGLEVEQATTGNEEGKRPPRKKERGKEARKVCSTSPNAEGG